MIIQKNLETYIDLIEPHDILSANKDDVCIRLLTNKFVNKCYKSCFILKINKIIRTSGRYMTDNLDGYASICVLFEVDAIVYQENEIINGCQITKIESYGQIYAESQYASIQLKQDQASLILKEKNIIPIIVKTVRYFPNKDKISVAGISFIPIFHKLVIYKVKSPLENQYIPQLQAMFDLINDEINKIKKFSTTQTKSYTFFKTLLYPFKKEQQFELNTDVKQFKFKKRNLELKEIMSINNGLICRPVELEKYKQQFYYSNLSDKINNDTIIIEDSMFHIAMNILNDYLLHIISLRELSEYYSSLEIITKYKDIWTMYKKLKK